MQNPADRSIQHGFEINLAKASDAAAIADLSRRHIEHGMRWNWREAKVLRYIRSASCNVAVAKAAGRLIGFGIMEYREHEAHLVLFAVSPLYRRRGVGSAIFEWLRETTLVAGVATVSLELREENLGALAFYRAMGFRETGVLSGYYENRENAIRMTRANWGGETGSEWE